MMNFETDIYPALWHKLDAAFPEFGFVNKGDHWLASNADTTRKLPGAPRPSRVYAYRDNPLLIIHGGSAVSWFAYLNHGEHPQGKEFIAILKTLSQKAGVPFRTPRISPEDQKRLQQEHERQELLEAFFAYASQLLLHEQAQGIQALVNSAKKYLIKRKFPETAFEFGVYTTPDDVRATLKVAGFSDKAIEESGLLADDRWKGRLIGPWRDATGKILTFWARDVSGKSDEGAKYLYLKGGSKSSPFGMESRSKRDAVLVEGIFDALALRREGFDNVFAIGGSELSEAQVQSLRRARTSEVTLFLDHDGAGEKGTDSAINRLNRTNIQTYVVDPGTLWDAKDPDEFLTKYGKKELQDLGKRRLHAFHWKAKQIARAYQPSDGWNDVARTKVITAAIDFDFSITDLVKQAQLNDFFWKPLGEAVGLSGDAISERVQEWRLQKHQEAAKEKLRYELQTLFDTARSDLEAGEIDSALESIHERSEKWRNERRALQTVPPQTSDIEFDEYLEQLKHWRDRKEFLGLPQKTLRTLDLKTLGLRGLMLLAGAPNCGKTSLALQLGIDVLRNNTNACFLFVSLEMSRSEMINRVLCRLSGIDYRTFVFGSWRDDQTFTEQEWRAMQAAEQEFRGFANRLLILDSQNFPDPNVQTISEQAERIKADTGCEKVFILVDYLQVLPVPSHDARLLRTDLAEDKWRIGQMKALRDAGKGEYAVLVISEARKPSSDEEWGGELADVMGAARGSYTPDMVFLLRPLSDEELGTSGSSKGDGKRDDSKKKGREKREELAKQGVSINLFSIVKGRDGCDRGKFPVEFAFRIHQFTEQEAGKSGGE